MSLLSKSLDDSSFDESTFGKSTFLYVRSRTLSDDLRIQIRSDA